MPHLIHCGEVDTVRGSSVESLLELSGGPRLDEAQADSLDGPLTALFVFNGAFDGLDRHLQLNEPRAGVYCLFTLKWRNDAMILGLCLIKPLKGRSVQACPFRKFHPVGIRAVRRVDAFEGAKLSHGETVSGKAK